MTWEESMQQILCTPQNLITCTGQVWRQVFIAVVTVVAAIHQSQLGNPKCYFTFSCLHWAYTRNYYWQPQIEQFPGMNPLSCPAMSFSLWCRRNLLCLPFQPRASPLSLFTSSDFHQSFTIYTLWNHNSACGQSQMTNNPELDCSKNLNIF